MFQKPVAQRLPGVFHPTGAAVAYHPYWMETLPASLVEQARFTTDLGALFIDDCLAVLRQIPENTLDLVVTSPPYDGQPRYGNGEKYERGWYEDTRRTATRLGGTYTMPLVIRNSFPGPGSES